MPLSLSIPTIAPTLSRPPIKETLGKQLLKVWKRFETAQSLKAEREIVRVLQTMNTTTLADYGYTTQEIEAIQKGYFVSPVKK